MLRELHENADKHSNNIRRITPEQNYGVGTSPRWWYKLFPFYSIPQNNYQLFMDTIPLRKP